MIIVRILRNADIVIVRALFFYTVLVLNQHLRSSGRRNNLLRKMWRRWVYLWQLEFTITLRLQHQRRPWLRWFHLLWAQLLSGIRLALFFMILLSVAVGVQISIILISLYIWQFFYRISQERAGVDHALLEEVQLISLSAYLKLLSVHFHFAISDQLRDLLILTLHQLPRRHHLPWQPRSLRLLQIRCSLAGWHPWLDTFIFVLDVDGFVPVVNFHFISTKNKINFFNIKIKIEQIIFHTI